MINSLEIADEREIFDTNKLPRFLEKEIGSGGEGKVFTIKDFPEIVAKIYLSEKLKTKREFFKEKINFQSQIIMLKKNPNFTWPQISIFNKNGEWIGYVMRKAEGIPLSKLAHARLYKKYFPQINRIKTVAFLLKLLDLVDILHKQQIYLGDINLNNFLLDPKTFNIYCIDNDSYQISNGSKQFPCPVGKAEMTPPEHQGIPFEQITRNKESDLFSLSILIFQCFMLGRHPYDNIGGGNPVENLKRGHFPYGTNGARPGTKGALPSGPWYCIWSHLTYQVKHLFIRTFKDGIYAPKERATLSEWKEALNRYQKAMEQNFNTTELQPSSPKNS